MCAVRELQYFKIIFFALSNGRSIKNRKINWKILEIFTSRALRVLIYAGHLGKTIYYTSLMMALFIICDSFLYCVKQYFNSAIFSRGRYIILMRGWHSILLTIKTTKNLEKSSGMLLYIVTVQRGREPPSFFSYHFIISGVYIPIAKVREMVAYIIDK